MGGGGDIPDVPDYSEVIGMLKDQFKISNERAQEMWDWGKKAYETNSGVGRQAITAAFDQMKKLAGDADYFRNQYRTMYAPAEKKQLEEALKMGTPGEQAAAASGAMQDVATKVKSAREAALDRLRGFGLADSAIATGDLATRVAEAGMQASAGNAAREAKRKEAQDALAQALGIGQANLSRVNPAAAGALNAGTTAASIGPAIDTANAQIMGNVPTHSGQAMQSGIGAANVQNMGFENAMKQNEAENASDPFGQILGFGLNMGSKFFGFEGGGAIPDQPTQMFATGGGPIPEEMSPTNGQITDDVPAQINGDDGGVLPAQLNAGEFVMPEDVTRWVGEKGMQQFIMKARKEMGDPNQAPAQPEMAGGPPPTMDGAGIPPLPAGVA